jgi:hypothetical protein
LVNFNLRPLYPWGNPCVTRYEGVEETEDTVPLSLKTETVYGQLQPLAILSPGKSPIVEI